jgi:hydroxymethylglutaryl-CoA lyase
MAHSLANVRRTPDDMVAEFSRIRTCLDRENSSVKLIAGLSTVFGCTLQGVVTVRAVCDIVRKCLDAGADVIALADTTGHATPLQVGQVIEDVKEIAGPKFTSMHFHDTRGMGLPNTLVALEHGIREFDASLAGLGGCPHAPGATGNVVTEDLVFMLESMGYATGVDLAKLIASRHILQEGLPNEPLYGFIARAGIPETYPLSPVQ